MGMGMIVVVPIGDPSVTSVSLLLSAAPQNLEQVQFLSVVQSEESMILIGEVQRLALVNAVLDYDEFLGRRQGGGGGDGPSATLLTLQLKSATKTIESLEAKEAKLTQALTQAQAENLKLRGTVAQQTEQLRASHDKFEMLTKVGQE